MLKANCAQDAILKWQTTKTGKAAENAVIPNSNTTSRRTRELRPDYDA